MQGRPWVPLLTALLLSVPSILMGSFSSNAEQTTFPENHLLHDYEPSVDEQWDLDAAVNGNGNLFTVWADDRDLDVDIRFAKSLNGTSWGDGIPNNDKVVNDDPVAGYDHLDPSIAVDGKGRLYVVWLDTRGPEARLRIAMSNNSGGLWTPGREVSEITGEPYSPMVRWSATLGLCIVYVEDRTYNSTGETHSDIMFIRSTDEGQTFSPPFVVNDDGGATDQMNPRMASAKDGTVCIAWEDMRNDDGGGGNIDVYMDTTRTGTSFEGNAIVGTDPEGERQSNPDVAFSGSGDLIVAFQEYGQNGWRIRYALGWSASSGWDRTFYRDYQATKENLSIVMQYSPRVDFGNGAFSLAWIEKDLRDFNLVKTGYISREGETVLGDHIVDDTISLGTFIKDPQVYIAEMYRETSNVVCFGGRTHVFWTDCRTDPVPTDDIAQDSDPYTAQAVQADGVPIPPSPVRLEARDISWDSFKVGWTVPLDIGFKAVYLKVGKGTISQPDENIFDLAIPDRLVTDAAFDGLDPDSIYQVKLTLRDDQGRKVFSEPIQVRTLRNQPPTFRFIEPDGIDDEVDGGMLLRWTAKDADGTANYTLYFDRDLDPSDQVFLHEADTSMNRGEGELFFDTSTLPSGGYTINATIHDHINPPVTVYSPAIIVRHTQVALDHPSVLSCVIEGGRENAYRDAMISVVFTKEMMVSTLDIDSVHVIDGVTFSKRSGSITMNGPAALDWRPKQPLTLGTTYSLVITPQAMDMEGNGLDGQNIGSASTYIMQFRTRPDNKAPELRSWSPQGQGIKLRPEMSARFDVPLDPDTVTNGTVTLKGPAGITVPITVSYDEVDWALKASIRTLLKGNSTYTITLSQEIMSAKGVHLNAPLNWSFMTGTPDMSVDTDGDGTPDDLDPFPNDPSEDQDTDGDQIGDNTDLDDDGDGMPDLWEERYGLDPKNGNDADGDADSDGKSNLEEYREGTPPNRAPEEGATSPWLFALILSAIILVVVFLVYALVQRKKLETERLEREFFREE